MYATAFNTTDAPVVTDQEGRTIGGGEWGTVETTADAVKAALASDSLVLVETPGEDVTLNPGAKDAIERTARISAAAEALSPMDKKALATLAEEHAPHLVEADKADLVAGLALREVAPPAKGATKSASAPGGDATTTSSERA